MISVNKISDAVRKNCLKKWRNFDIGEQPITIKLCVFVMEMANKHDGNDINIYIKAISLSGTSLQAAGLTFGCSIDHLGDKRRRKGTRLTFSANENGFICSTGH